MGCTDWGKLPMGPRLLGLRAGQEWTWGSDVESTAHLEKRQRCQGNQGEADDPNRDTSSPYSHPQTPGAQGATRGLHASFSVLSRGHPRPTQDKACGRKTPELPLGKGSVTVPAQAWQEG